MYGKSYKTVSVTSSITDVVSSAFGELSGLGEEMRETAENMSGNNMEHLPKYEVAEQAADTLENATGNEPDEVEGVGDVKVTFSEGVKPGKQRGQESRAARLGNACGGLSAVVEKLETLMENMKEAEEDVPDEHLEAFELLVSEMETLRDACQECLDEVESVEFPGFYG